MNASTKDREDFITSPKIGKEDIEVLDLKYNCLLDYFIEVDAHSFASVWSLSRKKLVFSAWNEFYILSCQNSIDDLRICKIELGLLRDSIGCYSTPNITHY